MTILSPSLPSRCVAALLGATLLLPAAFSQSNAGAASGPTVTLSEPVAVTVTAPVEVQGSVEVLNPSLQRPYFLRVEGNIAAGMMNNIVSFPAIPAGKRLVIETISVRADAAAGQKILTELYVSGTPAQSGIELNLALQSQGVFGATEIFVGTHKVRLVIDRRLTPGMDFAIWRSATPSGGVYFKASIAGYLEDEPAVIN